MKKITVQQSKGLEEYPSQWFKQSHRPSPTYFTLTRDKDGWDKVKYFLGN